MAEGPGGTEIRDAATVVLVRRDGPVPRVLMGQRGAGAAFMPSKFVFPGGAIDPADPVLAAGAVLEPETAARLAAHAPAGLGPVLALAAIRETYEETGLALARPGALPGTVPEAWAAFRAQGLRPATEALRLIFRAVTPPGRTRRFDARFFLADAAELVGDPEDFSRASGELAHLGWVTLEEVRRLEMPFVTEIVLAEVAAILAAGGAVRRVPFFTHDSERSHFLTL